MFYIFMQLTQLRYNSNNIEFKGYDARPLRGLFVLDKSCEGAVNQLKKLTEKTGLDIFTPNIASKSINKEYASQAQQKHLLWCQDYLTNTRKKFIIFDKSRDFLTRILRGVTDGMKKDLGLEPFGVPEHIRGGNFFICNNNGREELLINKLKGNYTEDVLKMAFNVERIHYIPSLDYHLDLFIRPLKDGKVLVADDSLTMKGLKTGIDKINEYLCKNNVDNNDKKILHDILDKLDEKIKFFDVTLNGSPRKPIETTEQVAKALTDAGYEPIKVPANYYILEGVKTADKVKEHSINFEKNSAELRRLAKTPEELRKVEEYIEIQKKLMSNSETFGVELNNLYSNNFVNAIVTEKDGKIIYITNASLLDKQLGITPEIENRIDFSMKKLFVDSVKPYIDKENIHFINEDTTEKLFEKFGGVHCIGAEIVL